MKCLETSLGEKKKNPVNGKFARSYLCISWHWTSCFPNRRKRSIPSSLISLTPFLAPASGWAEVLPGQGRVGRSPFQLSQTITLLLLEALYILLHLTSAPFVPRSPPRLCVPSADTGGGAASPSAGGSPGAAVGACWGAASRTPGCSAAESPFFRSCSPHGSVAAVFPPPTPWRLDAPGSCAGFDV